MGEHELSTTPVPDPTILTTEAQERADRVAREWVESQLAIRDVRLERIDLATQLRAESVAKDIEHAQELAAKDDQHQAEMSDMRFKERDERTRSDASKDKLALDAALAAQKESASETNKANTKAIDKSEAATAETIRQQGASFQSQHNALVDKVDDLKEQLGTVAGRLNGASDQRSESREQNSDTRGGINLWIGVGGFVIALISIIVMAWSMTRTPATEVVPTQTPAVTVTVPSGG